MYRAIFKKTKCPTIVRNVFFVPDVRFDRVCDILFWINFIHNAINAFSHRC